MSIIIIKSISVLETNVINPKKVGEVVNLPLPPAVFSKKSEGINNITRHILPENFIEILRSFERCQVVNVKYFGQIGCSTIV